jgi:hypothetical protein
MDIAVPQMAETADHQVYPTFAMVCVMPAEVGIHVRTSGLSWIPVGIGLTDSPPGNMGTWQIWDAL